MPAFPHLALGTPIPPSPHAVSCSLPTMRAVRGYEEKDPAILSQLTNGYPRFVVHPFTRQLVRHCTEATPALHGRTLWLTSSAAMARASERLLTWVTERPTDALAWQTLATLYRAQNQALRAVRADAEAQVAMLDYPGAIDRFKSAQNLARSQPQADHFELSILDARTREITRIQTEIERDAADQRSGR